MAKRILSPNNMGRIVRMLGAGVDVYFHDLTILQMAIDKKGSLAQDFFFNNGGCYETWGYEWRPKSELKAIRNEVISAITQKINEQSQMPYKERMEAIYYARYLHALALLNVDKSHFSITKHDHMLNAYLELWELDDGSEKMWKILESSSLYISEAIKSIRGMPINPIVITDK